MKRLFKKKSRAVEETPVEDEDIRKEAKITEDYRPLFTDLYSKLSPYLMSASANCDSGKILGDLLITYGKKFQSDSIVLSNCLQTIGEFHNFLEDTKLKLSTVLLESFCVTMKEFVDTDVEEALSTKRQLDKQKSTPKPEKARPAVSSSSVGKEKGRKLKNEQPVAESMSADRLLTYRDITTPETYYKLLDANEKGRYLLLSKSCFYLEEYFNFFKEGFNWLSQVFPQLEKYRLEAECLEEEYNDNIKIRNGEISEEDLEKERIFGVPLELIIERQKVEIPIIVTESINYLMENGASKEGILRLPGNNREIQHLKTALDRGRTPDFSKVKDPHTVAGLLKMYLYSLPDPLLPPALFDRLIGTAKINGPVVAEEMKKILRFVPPANHRILDRLLQLALKILTFSSVNKMTPQSVACLLAPAILYKPQRAQNDTPQVLDPAVLLQETNLASKVIEIFILNFDFLFERKEKEKEKDDDAKEDVSTEEEQIPDEEKKKKRRKNKKKKGKVTESSSEGDILGYSSDSLSRLSITIPQRKKGLPEDESPTMKRDMAENDGALTDRTKRKLAEPHFPVPLSRITSMGSASISNFAAFYHEQINEPLSSPHEAPERPQNLGLMRRKHDSTILSIANPLALCNAMDDIFCSKSFSGWVLVGYVNPTTIEFKKSGVGLEDLAMEFNDDEIQYSLIRLPLGITDIKNQNKELKKTRDVFLLWVGANIGQIEKGRKRTHLGDVKELLQPFHSELTVTSKKNLTLEVVLERSAPHSGAHIID